MNVNMQYEEDVSLINITGVFWSLDVCFYSVIGFVVACLESVTLVVLDFIIKMKRSDSELTDGHLWVNAFHVYVDKEPCIDKEP